MKTRAQSLTATVLLVGLAYFATGRLGLMLPALGSHITLIWLPTGIAVAALLRFGFGCWPGVALGSAAVNLAVGSPWPMVLAIAAGNTLGPLLAAWTLRRAGFHPTFDRKRDIVILAGAAVLGMLVSASVGTAALAFTGLLPEGRLAAWLIWWAGDATGVIAAAPLVFAFTAKEMSAVRRQRGEFTAWLAATVLLNWAVFVLNHSATENAWSLAFLPMLMAGWAALRYGPVGTSLALVISAVAAAYGMSRGYGPFYRARPIEGMTVLWIFMASTATLGWLITALQAARVHATDIQRLFDRALTDVSLGILLAGLDRRLTYANAGFTRLTGYSEEELLGKSCAILQGPATDPQTVALLKAALDSGGFFEGDILNYRKDGTTFWNALLISPVRDQQGQMTGFFGIQRNVSPRKQAELALQESELRYRQLFEANPHPMWVYDLGSLRFLAVNAAAIAHYGYSREEFLAMTIKDIRPPEEVPALLTNVRAVGHGLDQAGVWRHRKRDGAIIEVEITSHVLEFAGRRAEVVLANDITARRRLEHEREHYFKFFQICTDPMCIADPFGCFKQVNAAFCQLTGYAEDELLAKPFMDFVHPDDRAKTAEEMKLQVAVRPSINFENRYVCKDGRIVLLSWTANFDQNDGVTYATARDITQLRQAEDALRDSEYRWKFAIEGSGDGLWDWDVASNSVFYSRRWKEMLGYREDEIGHESREWQSRVHPEDLSGALAAMRAHFDGRESIFSYEHRIRAKDGAWRWILARGLAVSRDAAGQPLRVIGTHSDTTSVREAKLERERLERKVQETQKLESLGVLAGGIAHDFNNLLTSILGNASLAAMDVAAGSSVHECLEQINEASLRAADLCKQMLAYSGRGRFVVQTLDLGELVEQTAQMLQISISKKAVLRFRLEKGLPPVEVDATQIRQVIMNLVINASEAIGDRSGVISLSTGLTRVDPSYLAGTLMDTELPEGDYVFLEVSDSGSGMSAETQARIFDPFFTTKFTGRGLGLAAVLGIVRGHQGALKVYSELGRGTTFTLLFPAASGPGETAVDAPPSVPAWRGEGTVLVVDDEETMRSTVARMTRKLGLEPVLARHGLEAVEIFRADPGRFAVVLLDLTMPHLDGEQTFTELRRIRPDVRVVLMSGFNAQEALVRFTGKGLANFMQKPFTFDHLRAVLQAIIG